MSTSFNAINQALQGSQSPTAISSRNEFLKLAQLGKIVSVATALVGSVALLSSVVFSVAHPILGALGIAFSLTILLASYDVYKIASNINGLFQQGNIVSAWLTQLMGTLTPDLLVSKMFENTIIAEALFHTFAADFFRRTP